MNDLEEVNAMLAERVMQWTDEWKLEAGMEGGMESQAALINVQLP